MLLIIQNWILTSLICFAFGDMFVWVLLKNIKTEKQKLSDNLMFWKFLSGLSLVTFLGNVFSFFTSIGLLFYCTILLSSLIWLVLHLRRITKEWKRIFRELRSSFLIGGVTILLVFVVLIKSSLLPDNADQWGYYLPLVRWIENYAVVPGIGLINGRFGFNSAYHMSASIFSKHFVFDQGIYVLSGLIFILLFTKSSLILKRLYTSQAKIHLHQIVLPAAMIFPFYFMVNSIDADYPSVFLGIFLLSILLKRIRFNTIFSLDLEFFLYLILGLYLFTVRPFSGIYLIYPCVVFCRNLFKAQARVVLFAGILSLIYIGPWLLRNYYISGYLIYPLYLIDLFNPSWKTPELLAENTYHVIREFAKIREVRTSYFYEGLTSPELNEWLPGWLKINYGYLIGKIVLVGVPLSLVSSLVLLFKKSFGASKKILLSILIAFLVFCFFNFPSIRFAWAALMIFMGINFFYWLERYNVVHSFLPIVLSLLIGFSFVRAALGTVQQFSFDLIVAPQAIPQAEMQLNSSGESNILQKSTTEYCYGVKPICIPSHNNLIIKLRGSGIEHGFTLEKD